MAEKSTVAIIGGGISGLSVAYFLTKLPDFSERYEVTLFEEHAELGGNAATFEVELGKRVEDGQPFKRTVDLGVNDFNASTYKTTVAVMNELLDKHGRKADEIHRPLEDTICFFTRDGRISYALDGGLKRGVASNNYVFPETDLTPHALVEISDVFRAAAEEAHASGKYRDRTLGDFIDEFVANIEEAKRERARQFADYMLLPRTEAMYFTTPSRSDGLPFEAAMEYFMLQEGGGEAGEPDRRYFVHGARGWLELLARDVEQAGVILNRGKAAKLKREGRAWFVSTNGQDGDKPQKFDRVVLAVHADTARECLKGQCPEPYVDILSKVTYQEAVAVCHGDARVLSHNVNHHRSFNVRIRGEGEPRGYLMSYVENRHQNDGESERYNDRGLPEVYITVGSKSVIDEIPPYLRFSGKPTFAGKAAAEQPFAWSSDGPAMVTFKHNVLDFKCYEAQQELQGALVDERSQGLYLCGGWASGAGLHENCVAMGQHIALVIDGAVNTKPSGWVTRERLKTGALRWARHARSRA